MYSGASTGERAESQIAERFIMPMRCPAYAHRDVYGGQPGVIRSHHMMSLIHSVLSCFCNVGGKMTSMTAAKETKQLVVSR